MDKLDINFTLSLPSSPPLPYPHPITAPPFLCPSYTPFVRCYLSIPSSSVDTDHSFLLHSFTSPESSCSCVFSSYRPSRLDFYSFDSTSFDSCLVTLNNSIHSTPGDTLHLPSSPQQGSPTSSDRGTALATCISQHQLCGPRSPRAPPHTRLQDAPSPSITFMARDLLWKAVWIPSSTPEFLQATFTLCRVEATLP